jgi:hypothetical protein
MATDISGIWDLSATNDGEVIEQHLLSPIPPNSSLRVCFVSVEGGRYKGRYYDPELPQRSYPNWPYDSTFEARVLASSAQGQAFEVVSIVEQIKSSPDVKGYDSYQTFAGTVRPEIPGEPAPVMFGFAYGNNGDMAMWAMRKNIALGGCPEGLFEG